MKNLRLLVLSTDYPNNKGGLALAYVRTRNVYYLGQGAKVDVINFSTDVEYTIDDISVHTKEWFSTEKASSYDLLICHAPNLRNHYKFLLKYGNLFQKKVFFFHGHEVLKINKVYSKPYSFLPTNKIKNLFQNTYDDIKLLIWRKYFENNYNTSYCIFVSNWMKDEFYKWTKLQEHVLTNREFITYNSVGEIFEKELWNKGKTKEYDYITIRAYLDGSKYSVDIVNNLAWNNPDKKFLLIGQGEFFNHYKKAPNITWIAKRLNHKEMCEFLDLSKCALMPTRTDAQGVMMCEMAAYGMPLITSDIPVCHEVFDGMTGIGYIDNEDYRSCDINDIYKSIKDGASKNPRYFYSIVGEQEFGILNTIAEK